MNTTRLMGWTLAGAMLLVLPSFAAADGWLPSWNPFKSKAKPATSRATARIGDDGGGSDWSLTGKKSTSPFGQANTGPSTWQKVSSGTANAWKKTTATLTPWKKETPKQKVTGSRGFRNSAQGKKASSSTWYNPMTWGKSEEPARPKTVPEFINQKRLDY